MATSSRRSAPRRSTRSSAARSISWSRPTSQPRGLDIVSLPCVINYDVPTHAGRLRARRRAHGPGRPGGPGVHPGAARGAPLRRRDHEADRQGHPKARAARRRGGPDGEAPPPRRGTARNGARASVKQTPAERDPAGAAPAARRGAARSGTGAKRPSAKEAAAEPEALERSPAPRRSPPRATRAERPAPARPARVAADPIVGMGDRAAV